MRTHRPLRAESSVSRASHVFLPSFPEPAAVLCAAASRKFIESTAIWLVGWRRAWGRYVDYSSPGLSPPSQGGAGDVGGGPGCWQRTTLFCVSCRRSWAVPATAAEGRAAGRGLRLFVPLAALPWRRGKRVGSTVSNHVCDTGRFLLCAICPDSIHLSCPQPLWS